MAKNRDFLHISALLRVFKRHGFNLALAQRISVEWGSDIVFGRFQLGETLYQFAPSIGAYSLGFLPILRLFVAI